jgi:hypothetical protein
MADTIPSEFRAFIRETGVRAFDQLSERLDELDTPLRAIMRGWSRLSSSQKGILIDHAIDHAQVTPEPKPAPRKSTREAMKRYDPEEVARTLPKAKPKKAKAKAAKAKPKAKKKPAAAKS